MTAPREQPSWLMLERYALGELAESDRRAVQQALSSDPLSAECMTRIQAEVRALPPLPTVDKVVASESRQASRFVLSWFGWRFGAALVTVAAIGLFVLSPSPTFAPRSSVPSAIPGGPSSVKGDAIAISLVRERNGSVAWDPTVFARDDRFKVRVTCAVAGSVFANVVVYQDDEASFPIDAQSIACGNHVVLDGAFRLTESVPARVCVVLSVDAPVDRKLLEQDVPAVDASCTNLTPGL